MTELIAPRSDAAEALKQLLRTLLETNRVAGVITLAHIDGGSIAYSLVTDPQKVDGCVPLYPLMPTNLGQILDRLTRNGAPAEPLAVVARPCELRALVELVKRRKGRIENFFFISHTCAGVFPTSDSLEDDFPQKLPDYWQATAQGRIHPGLRPACRSCVEFMPYTADLVLKVVGGYTRAELFIKGERGRGLIEGLPNLPLSIHSEKLETMEPLLKLRRENRERLLDQGMDVAGLKGLVSVFGRCIGCHACSKACPICHCNLCTFESGLFERSPSDLNQSLLVKHGTRLPPDTIFFHLGRMVHMATSCVACGSCEDVCPVDIPVSLIFKRVGESLQKQFDYIPGKSLDDPLPVSVFEVEEFIHIEGKRR